MKLSFIFAQVALLAFAPQPLLVQANVEQANICCYYDAPATPPMPHDSGRIFNSDVFVPEGAAAKNVMTTEEIAALAKLQPLVCCCVAANSLNCRNLCSVVERLGSAAARQDERAWF
ncbi:hypothetical protein BDZ97DRAFT_1912822 [Flammula alnicola]|nr:hypothetical protein BDZ97DRAFT_1912822 [Flammula alnicola]